MPEPGNNNPPETTDHDHLIETMASVRRIESDMILYRDRYHDSIAPNVQRTIAEVVDIKKRLEGFEVRLSAADAAKAEIADHKDECTRYNRSNEGRLVSIESKIDQNQRSLADLVDKKAEVLAQRISDNAKERHAGQWSIIKWVAGLIFGGMGALLVILWKMLEPHIVHFPIP